MEVLYTSHSIHARIKKIFSSPSPNDRRIAIVAFIGQDVKAFLPSPKNMIVICNPDPVATSLEGIQFLKSKGANVMFSNSLHMKIYYSKERGCVITSANLSNNALGSGNLKEVGIFIPSKYIDINRLIEIAKPYNISKDKLIELDRKSKRTRTILKNSGQDSQKEKPVEFKEWYISKEYKLWKLGWYEDEMIAFAEKAKEYSYINHGKKEPHYAMNFEKDQIKSADWLLCFKINANLKVSQIGWMYVDAFVKVEKNEEAYYKDYPYQAIQVNPNSKYTQPPFKLTNEFKKAFRKALSDYGIEKIERRRNLNPPAQLIEMIYRSYAKE